MPQIPLARIQPSHLNPRFEFQNQDIRSLSESIRRVGLLEPIIVRPKGKRKFEIVVGERRYRAARLAGLAKIPAKVAHYTDEQVLELSLVENIQREDLSAVEKAKACRVLRRRLPGKYPTWKSVAEYLGVDEKTVQDWVRTLDLPGIVRRLIAPKQVDRVPPGKINYDSAIRIARKIKSPKKQAEVAREFAQRPVPWRAARQILKEVAKNPQRSVQRVMRRVIDHAPIYLPFSKVHADAILKLSKTQTSRKSKEPRLRRGAVVTAQITHFADLEVTDVYRKRLGDFDEEDAKREGGYQLEEFRTVWKRLHGVWDPTDRVYVIRFRLLRAVSEGGQPE